MKLRDDDGNHERERTRSGGDPAADDPRDVWSIVTAHGQGWVDRYAELCVDAPALRQALTAAVRQVDVQMSPWRSGSDLTRLHARRRLGYCAAGGRPR